MRLGPRRSCPSPRSQRRPFTGISQAKMPSCSRTWKSAIERFGIISRSPLPQRICDEALVKFEQMANWPEVIGCPFLRIASEYPDTAHPFHRRVIEHKDKLRDYLAEFLEPDPVDRRRSGSGDTWCHRWRPFRQEWSMALRRRFRFSRPPRQYSRASRARELDHRMALWCQTAIPKLIKRREHC